jgi:hypothetical protein
MAHTCGHDESGSGCFARFATDLDDVAHIRWAKADAITMQVPEGYEIVLTADASRFAAFHEWLHVARFKRGYGPSGGSGENRWIDEFLARHAQLFGLDR